MGTILLIVLVLLLIGAIPAWPHSKQWGFAPSGGLGLILVVVLVLVLMGRIYTGPQRKRDETRARVHATHTAIH